MGLRNKIKEKYEARAAKVEQKQMEKLVKAAERKPPVVVEYTSLSTMGDYDIPVNGIVIEGVFGDSRTAQRRAEQIEKILREKGFEVL